MATRISRRTTKDIVDLDLKGLQHETTIYDATQTGEVLSVVDDKKLLFKIDCRLMPILYVGLLRRNLNVMITDAAQMYYLRTAINR
jgi:hypothetical protein